MGSLALGLAGASLITPAPLPACLSLLSHRTAAVIAEGQLETRQEAEGRYIHFYFKALCEKKKKKSALPKLEIKPEQVSL